MLTLLAVNLIIFLVCLFGMIFAAYNARWVSKIQLHVVKLNKPQVKDLETNKDRLLEGEEDNDEEEEVQKESVDLIKEIGEHISIGANEFLMNEYKYLTGYVIVMAIVVLLAVDINFSEGTVQVYTMIAFVVGCYTSILSGWIGMKIAVYSNVRTAFEAQKSLEEAFHVAFRAGCVMGFGLVSIALVVLALIITIYRAIYSDLASHPSNFSHIMESVAGYGLGGSSVALFSRVGGGIFTKAADVGADLVGKVEHDLPEDSPKNPATVADNVGDNVGDIAGMGADLFGSFAESTCAALTVAATCPEFINYNDADNLGVYLYYPLLISAFGILCSFITTFFATNFMHVHKNDQIERTLKYQLIISTIILTPVLYGVAVFGLPEVYHMEGSSFDSNTPLHAWVCTVSGLWGGLIIGWFTEYMTSHSYGPVREIADACHTSTATNIIYGLALGYFSTVVPVLSIGVAAYLSHKFLGMFGIALAALGMLSNLAIGLAIDAYGPISDNAGGIAEMSKLGEHIRHRTDALDAAGNTTAAIGKGFAIGSAALVSLSLYGAFVTRAHRLHRLNPTYNNLLDSDIMDPLIFTGLLFGAMLPYLFSAFTMRSVGQAAMEMVKEVRRQLQTIPGIKEGTTDPDYKACVRISTQASLKEMVAPGMLVIFTPLVIGFLFGPKAIAGLLPGALVSGVQMAIASSNSGGAWDNAKKYIEGGHLIINGEKKGKGTDEHKAAVIGDTVGDPLKDTSGPSLNILVKLMAILSLVFTEFFCRTGYLVVPFGEA